MNLNHLTDDVLLAETERAAYHEREALSVVLHHIREVDRRRLYSALKFESLADYMIKHLKYTEDQTYPRISAMKLLKEIPEIEAKINDGTLSLSNLNMARRAFLQETKAPANTDSSALTVSKPHRTTEEKIAVLAKIENVTKREAEKILRIETGVVLKSAESSRELSDGNVELKSIVSKDVVQLIAELKGLFAHSQPGITTGQLVELALKELKKQKDPVAKAERAAKRPVPERKSAESSNPHFIPAAVRHVVWMRDGGRCTNCGSANAIQHEHIIPVALGGKSTVENVTLLCRSCNQRRAIEVFGAKKMSRYLREPTFGYEAELRIDRHWLN
ncbi:MAG: HNH endonuclease [Bdellovibrionota bacterium]